MPAEPKSRFRGIPPRQAIRRVHGSIYLDAVFIGYGRNLFECYLELPVRRNGSAVLVAVRVAQHDLLQFVHGAHRFTVDRQAEELAHDFRRGMKIVNRLE